MGSLTATQRKRLAREARKLAMECVEGTAPKLGVDMLFNTDPHRPVCVLGHLYFRATGTAKMPAALLGYYTYPERALLVEANNESKSADRRAAVVFPLLALADALEEAQP